MKVFKVIVILVAVGLLIGFTLLFGQMQKRKARIQSEAATLLPPQKGPSFDLKVNGKVTALYPHEKGLALLIDQTDGGQELILMDLKGNPLRRIRLLATP